MGRLESDDLALVRRKRDEIARGSPAATDETLAVDDDPEYQDWRREVLARARAALARGSGQAAEQPGGKVVAFPSRRWRSLAVPLAAAASIFVAVTLGFDLVTKRRQPLVGLHPTWFTTLQVVRGSPKVITVPSTADYVLLMVDVNDPDPYPAYRLEIGERGTEVHWESGDLPRTGVEEVSAALPRRWLTAGEYPLRIYGVREGRAELVAEYTLQVEIE